jgi:F-type H+-transporting ATPase subunit a
MHTPSVFQFAAMGATLILAAVALRARFRIPLPAQSTNGDEYLAAKQKRSRYATLGLLCLLLCASIALRAFEGAPSGTAGAARVNILGLSVASSVVTAWAVIGAILLLAALARIFVIPHFREAPKGVQTVLEASVTATGKVAGAGRRFSNFFKRHKRFFSRALIVILIWVALGLLLGMVPSPQEELHVSISPARVDILGYSVSSTVLVAWIVIAVLAVAAAILRFTVIPRFKETPKGMQNVLELMVDEVSKFTSSRFGHENERLAAYFFALAALFIGSAVIELFGVRPPDTDLTMTLSYAIITFVMINYYGIRKRGLRGRLKSFTEPNAIVTPFKVLSDFAIPISLACRLFGNMLGGMVVVDLIYIALGSFSVGIPAVLGLYFNAFHPLIQFFIFINLSLTFIGEAAE